MLKIRLTRTGRKHLPSYRIVVANRRSKRDGDFVEYVGVYNPSVTPKLLTLNVEAIKKWLKNGAQPTPTVRALLEKEGILAKTKENKKVFKCKPGKKALAKQAKETKKEEESK